MEPLYLSCSLEVDGAAVGGDHVVRHAGPNALTITSCSFELGLELQSIYLGGQACPQVLVSEYLAIGAGGVELGTRWMNAAEGVLPYAPARCLYDHLQRLQDVAEERLGIAVAVSDLAQAEAELRLGATLP